MVIEQCFELFNLLLYVLFKETTLLSLQSRYKRPSTYTKIEVFSMHHCTGSKSVQSLQCHTHTHIAWCDYSTDLKEKKKMESNRVTRCNPIKTIKFTTEHVTVEPYQLGIKVETLSEVLSPILPVAQHHNNSPSPIEWEPICMRLCFLHSGMVGRSINLSIWTVIGADEIGPNEASLQRPG